MRCLRLLALFWMLAMSAAGAAPAQKWAVLVGVDRYQRSDVTPLQCAVADVKALARALQLKAGFPAENIFVLTTDQTGDGEPTRANLAFRLGWLVERVQPGDTVLFFFSGHGMQMDETSYLLTCDADPRNATTLRMTAMSRHDLQDLLRSLRAQELLVMLDACRNDPRSGKGGGDNRLSAQMSRDLVLHRKSESPSYTATFFACTEGERSYEWADKGHGFFTWFLLQALNGAASKSSQLTLADLRRYLTTEIPKASERVTGQKQVPKIVVYSGQEKPVNEAECVVTAVKGGAPLSFEGGPVRPIHEPQPTPSPSVEIHETPQPPTTGAMDPQFVGTWKGGLGGTAISWQVDRNGRFTQHYFNALGQSAKSGTMTMGSGKWRMVFDNGHVYTGTYKVLNHVEVYMTNDQIVEAKGIWVRTGEAH